MKHLRLEYTRSENREHLITAINDSSQLTTVKLLAKSRNKVVKAQPKSSVLPLMPTGKRSTPVEVQRVHWWSMPRGGYVRVAVEGWSTRQPDKAIQRFVVYLRPLYELLALILLLSGCSGATAIGIAAALQNKPTVVLSTATDIPTLTFTPTTTPTSTFTPTDTPTQTFTPTDTPTPTEATPTLTFTPSFTPTPVPETCDSLGWQYFTVLAGDTWSGMLRPDGTAEDKALLDHAAQFNHISPPYPVEAGSKLCLPRLFRISLPKTNAIGFTSATECGKPMSGYVIVENDGNRTWQDFYKATLDIQDSSGDPVSYSIPTITLSQKSIKILWSMTVSKDFNQPHNLTATLSAGNGTAKQARTITYQLGPGSCIPTPTPTPIPAPVPLYFTSWIDRSYWSPNCIVVFAVHEQMPGVEFTWSYTYTDSATGKITQQSGVKDDIYENPSIANIELAFDSNGGSLDLTLVAPGKQPVTKRISYPSSSCPAPAQ